MKPVRSLSFVLSVCSLSCSDLKASRDTGYGRFSDCSTYYSPYLTNSFTTKTSNYLKTETNHITSSRIIEPQKSKQDSEKEASKFSVSAEFLITCREKVEREKEKAVIVAREEAKREIVTDEIKRNINDLSTLEPTQGYIRSSVKTGIYKKDLRDDIPSYTRKNSILFLKNGGFEPLAFTQDNGVMILSFHYLYDAYFSLITKEKTNSTQSFDFKKISSECTDLVPYEAPKNDKNSAYLYDSSYYQFRFRGHLTKKNLIRVV